MGARGRRRRIDGLAGHAVLSHSDAWMAGYYYPPSGGDTDPAVLSTTG
jgi:hypothetical protein